MQNPPIGTFAIYDDGRHAQLARRVQIAEHVFDKIQAARLRRDLEQTAIGF